MDTTEFSAELQAKIKQATDALEALDDHLNERINTLLYSNELNSPSNRLYTARSLFKEVVEMLNHSQKGASHERTQRTNL